MNEVIFTSVYSLFTISIATAIAFAIASETKFKPAIKTLCSLTVMLQIISVLSPVFSLLSELSFDEAVKPDIEGVENTELQINEAGKQLCAYTKDMLVSKYAINSSDFTVSATLEFESDTVTLKNVTVEFLTHYQIDYNAVALFVSETLMCECIVLAPEIIE